MTRVVIIGGGPGGYEAALVASQLGADVAVVDRDGLGGSAVLTDCVPSKTLVATAEALTQLRDAGELGVRIGGAGSSVGGSGGSSDGSPDGSVDVGAVNERVKDLALAQSQDIAAQLAKENVRIVQGTGRLVSSQRVVVDQPGDDQRGGDQRGDDRSANQELLDADVVLLATGARPRILPDAEPDGERILTWEQVYDLEELPEHLVVVGSGVTGAEFASAYLALGSAVTLVSSRDRVLPSEDVDARQLIGDVFTRRGMTVLNQSRAQSVERTAGGVAVTLTDGRRVEGSHCLLAVGSVPNTEGIGLSESGIALDERGYVEVDGVSRTSARGVYAAGDCSGVLMLASVSAMQGRIAMWHALGDAVAPLDLGSVSATVFTAPEIATVGWSERQVAEADGAAAAVTLPLGRNPRAKMQGIHHGFVKLFCRVGTGTVVGGVVVAPRASELIHPLALAVSEKLTVDQMAHGFTVYPSLSGSLAEAARRLHRPERFGTF